jgi:hypothetical protein
MPQRPRFLIGFYAIIALLMLAELLLSNIGTLAGNLDATAAMLGLSPDAERTRLVILIILDAVAGGGALLALWALLRPTGHALGRAGAWLTAIGMAGYGLYQIGAALLQLAPTWRGPILGVGVVYLLIGGLAAWLGRPLISAR